MSWYAKPYLIFFLYMLPTLFSVMAIFRACLSGQKKVGQIYLIEFLCIKRSSSFQCFQYSDGIWAVESLHFEVSKLSWTLFTLVMTCLGWKSAFFCMIWVLFPMAGRLFLEKLYDKSVSKKKRKGEPDLPPMCTNIVLNLN